MAAKLSPYKQSRLLELYLSGLSQSQVAQQLNIDQSTVSLCLAKFNKRSELYGLEYAAKEANVMESIYALHSLAVELKSNKLSIEEARQGIKVRDKLAQYGVPEGGYQQLVVAAGKLYDQGFLKAAVKLVALEQKTGMDYAGVIAKFEQVKGQVATSTKELEQIEAATKKAKEERASAEIKRAATEKELAQYLAGTTVTMKRLMAVEQLAALLKQGNVWDEELAVYMKRQEELNKSGISIALFGKIVSQVAPLALPDGGKQLLATLTNYGSLQEAVAGLQQQKSEMDYISAKIVEQTAQSKAVSDQVNGLILRRDQLAPIVESYALVELQANQLQETVAALETARLYHEGHNKALEEHGNWLSGRVEQMEARAAELEPLQRKHSDFAGVIAEQEKRCGDMAREMEILHAFLGYMKNLTPEALRKFILAVPLMFSCSTSKDYSPELIRKIILNDLTMRQMNIYACRVCGTRFYVDRAPRPKEDFTCPNCNTTGGLWVEFDAADALMKAGAIRVPGKTDATASADKSSAQSQYGTVRKVSAGDNLHDNPLAAIHQAQTPALPPEIKTHSAVISSTAVEPGATVLVTVNLVNTGNAETSGSLQLYVDDKEEHSREITVAGGKIQPVTWAIKRDPPGTYAVRVGNMPVGSFTVRK